jgi:hypothetical protein
MDAGASKSGLSGYSGPAELPENDAFRGASGRLRDETGIKTGELQARRRTISPMGNGSFETQLVRSLWGKIFMMEVG